MSYKIAVASSDGKNIDLSFGAAQEFLIYQVNELDYKLLETRTYDEEVNTHCSKKKCSGNESHCALGHDSTKVELIHDVRCVLCQKIGFQIRKQLEKKTIAAFDIHIEIHEAIDKIIHYFYKVDHHQSLRGIRKISD